MCCGKGRRLQSQIQSCSVVTDNMTVQKGLPKRQPMEKKKKLSRDTRSHATQGRVIRISPVM